MVEKAVWTDADFERMGWHDCPIRALAVDLSPEKREVALDLDYIVEWEQPPAGETNFSFLICPATLVFHEVSSLQGDLDVQGPFLELDGIEREQDRQWTKWRIIGHYFEWQLHASGFTQWLRRAPIRSETQDLSDEQRGGVSFARVGFTAPG